MTDLYFTSAPLPHLWPLALLVPGPILSLDNFIYSHSFKNQISSCDSQSYLLRGLHTSIPKSCSQQSDGSQTLRPMWLPKTPQDQFGPWGLSLVLHLVHQTPSTTGSSSWGLPWGLLMVWVLEEWRTVASVYFPCCWAVGVTMPLSLWFLWIKIGSSYNMAVPGQSEYLLSNWSCYQGWNYNSKQCRNWVNFLGFVTKVGRYKLLS